MTIEITNVTDKQMVDLDNFHFRRVTPVRYSSFSTAVVANHDTDNQAVIAPTNEVIDRDKITISSWNDHPNRFDNPGKRP